MIRFEKTGKFKIFSSNYEKKQIILCHSSREVSEYLTSLEVRYGHEQYKIPNYVIDRNGKIFKLLEDEEYSYFFPSDVINQKSIVICLENLGWLEKKPLSNDYINWIGDIYCGKVFEKKWRDYIFWEPYTEEQILSMSHLCKYLITNASIRPFVINSNTRIMDVDKIKGIVTRSNFEKTFTDLNPSFDFDNFTKCVHDGNQ